ncbi:DUF1553 domain-containing protein [Luteolibacter arcticus]|uniref:DUF1553 domain-containing protein n=1 Tax=Luteolibacter arcticus TaxID=1581411 RepID=A0ABT3GNM6_9BACT|nr:DUF1553 domain-containing protein [Luteolibacter arcticus]MCW1925089.1 DUF1553 domain-containing protein [Luteolibacter arcticus]
MLFSPRLALALAVVLSAAAEEVDFATQVQPILSEYCYHCHGPDAGTREAELRLDTKEGAYRVKDGLAAIHPGDSTTSEVIRRVLSDDPEVVMPPPKSKRVIPAADKELLKRWVDEGAKWGEHWAFVAPKRPEVPGGLPHPIEALVGERLKKEKLSPAPEAPKEKLLRRVSLDLTGLPPTAAELDGFLADHSPDAYDKAVDRLLASPRFGERMVWDWLDAARYADTNGFQGDPTRAMWYWRDWAIRAFNENMSYDRFTVEQLAGDLLPNPTQDQLLATGFHRNHMINGEGGRIPEESRVDYVMDRTETTATVWMGLTFQCSRCHDHKFDPISQRDYYQLSAFFNSIDESGGNDAGGLAHPVMTLATPEETQRIASLKLAESTARQERDALAKAVAGDQASWEKSLAVTSAAPVEWTVLHPESATSEAGATLMPQPDGSILVSGTNAETDEYLVLARNALKSVTAMKLEALPDPSFGNGGPGRANNGNFVLGELVVLGGGEPLGLEPVSADFEQGGWPLRHVADGKDDTGWAVMPAFGKAHEAVIAFDAPVPGRQPETLSFRLRFRTSNKQHTLGRFRISITNAPRTLLRPVPDAVKAALAVAAEQRNAAQQNTVRDFHHATEPRLVASNKRLAAATSARESAEQALPKTMIMRERAKPRDTHILIKGNWEARGDKVGYGVPAILPPLPAGEPPNRLTLAKWLVSPEHPLTARVTVNRYWQMFFGTGLVKTAEDFGVQGERPVHPQLLDWLAVEFRESGWDVKKLLRLIVTSATYKQSSVVPPGMAERDPDNRLLARGPRHRLPSWMLRDQALAASGLLVEKVGGPPVKGYQPAGVWEDATFGQIQYVQDHGDALYRRSLYTFWRRIVGPTMFFDVASRQSCAVRTGLTNTPLHALVTLNDVTYTEAARVLAQRMMKEGGGSDDLRLTHGFRLCTSRAPDEADVRLLLSALKLLRQQYQADPEAARKLIAAGESKPDAALDSVELAAFTGMASLLLNLDETLCNE